MSGRKKSLSKRLSRRDPDDEEFDEAIADFHDGSDRVAAILGAALIEANLVRALSSALTNTEEFAAIFHDEGAPLGTFRRRIVMGRALDLFSARVASDMDIIRDIRNQFAHALLHLDFENEAIAEECAKLDDYPFKTPVRTLKSNRLKFEKACWGISTFLIIKANKNLDTKLADLKSSATLGALIAAGLQSGAENVSDDI